MSYHITEQVLPLIEERRSTHGAKHAEFKEHPYRYVAFGLYLIQNIVFGTFISSYTPVQNALVKVN